jgi:hypothetical protein
MIRIFKLISVFFILIPVFILSKSVTLFDLSSKKVSSWKNRRNSTQNMNWLTTQYLLKNDRSLSNYDIQILSNYII